LYLFSLIFLQYVVQILPAAVASIGRNGATNTLAFHRTVAAYVHTGKLSTSDKKDPETQ
jgi:hypothetical protein